MDDLIAELTLRLNNQLNAGMDEVKAEFGVLESTLSQLSGVMSDLNSTLAGMKVPVAMTEGFDSVIKGADDSTVAIEKIGVAIDEDLIKFDKLKTAWAEGAGTFLPPTGDNDPSRPAFVPPGYLNGSGDETSEADDGGGTGGGASRRSGAPKENAHMGNPFTHWLTDFFAIATGVDAEKDYADFQETALQIANIEGLHGHEALTEATKIMHESYNQAYLSRGKVDDIEQAYYNLIRQQLPKQMVDQIIGPLSEAATAYGTPIADITQPAFNLADDFKIPGDEMTKAIAMLGQATHEGHYYFSDFSQGLPENAAQFQSLGMTGLDAEATALASLEIIRKGTPDSGTASTDLRDLLTYLTSGIAARFFDRTKRSEDLLGAPVLDLFKKYHIEPLNLPEFFNNEREDGKDPLNAMVDYMSTIGVGNMSPTDEKFVFNSLFHNQEAAQAMIALIQHRPEFDTDQTKLKGVSPNFLDGVFSTAIQGDFAGMNNLDLLGTYLYRLFGQNTAGLLAGNNAPSQADLDKQSPGASAFNIPINLTVNIDKSGNVTADAQHGSGPWANQPATPPGTSVKVNQGQVLGAN